MTTETDPRERPEIRTTDDLLTAVRVGLEIATRSDIHESEHRILERIGEKFDAQDARMDARFDAQESRFDAQDRRMDSQDARMDSFETRLNENTAAINENTAAIRELKTLIEADRRSRDRAIQWLSIGLGGLGALAAILGVAVALTGG